jgi:hypothetical protein
MPRFYVSTDPGRHMRLLVLMSRLPFSVLNNHLPLAGTGVARRKHTWAVESEKGLDFVTAYICIVCMSTNRTGAERKFHMEEQNAGSLRDDTSRYRCPPDPRSHDYVSLHRRVQQYYMYHQSIWKQLERKFMGSSFRFSDHSPFLPRRST